MTNPLLALKNYLLASYEEMKKVTWPSRRQTVEYSLFVVAISVAIAVFFGVLDHFFAAGLTAVLNR